MCWNVNSTRGAQNTKTYIINVGVPCQLHRLLDVRGLACRRITRWGLSIAQLYHKVNSQTPNAVRSALTVHLCVLYGPQNKERLFTCTGFGGLGVVCWPLVPKFAGSNPAEAEKNPQHAFLRRGSPMSYICGMWKIPKFTWKSEFGQNYYRTCFLLTVPPFAARISRVVADGGTWRLKWERLKAGESNGKLPTRTCPGCSVPEPHRSHDWALVPAKSGLQGWILINEWQ